MEWNNIVYKDLVVSGTPFILPENKPWTTDFWDTVDK